MQRHWQLLLGSALLLLGMAGSGIAASPACPTIPAPKFLPQQEWVYRTPSGTWTERVNWIDGEDVYLDLLSGKQAVGLKANQANTHIITTTKKLVTSNDRPFDFPLQVGKEWKYLQVFYPQTGGQMAKEVHTRKVLGCEEVTTPGGKFLALKILDQSALEDPLRYHLWYAAEGIVKRTYVEGEMRPMTADEPPAELIRYQPGQREAERAQLP